MYNTLCKKCKEIYTDEKSGICIQCQAQKIIDDENKRIPPKSSDKRK